MNDFLGTGAHEVVKIILCGAAGSGKSSLLRSFKGEPFEPSYSATIGVDFEIKAVSIPGLDRPVTLQVWDTAGHERFKTITTSYYRNADGVLLVYDMTTPDTFRTLDSWLSDIRAYSKENVGILLCGNKADLPRPRAVEYKEGKTYAEKHGLGYVETSAATGSNVDSAFTKVAAAAIKRKHELAAAAAGKKENPAATPSGIALSQKADAPQGSCCS